MLIYVCGKVGADFRRVLQWRRLHHKSYGELSTKVTASSTIGGISCYLHVYFVLGDIENIALNEGYTIVVTNLEAKLVMESFFFFLIDSLSLSHSDIRAFQTYT